MPMTNDEQWLLKEKYAGEKTEGFFADCERLRLGEPLAYVIGSIPFLHTVIYLDSHPLIPRTETEYWVEHVIRNMNDQLIPTPRALDLCAGSGCIGIALLAHIPQAHVDFAEIDTRHHSTIQKNRIGNMIADTRVQIFGGNLFENITDTYDFILSNPPYIDPTLNRTEESVTKYEPEKALYGGTDGLEFIERIIAQAPQFLTVTGTLIIEHEPEQTIRIHELGVHAGFSVRTHHDQFGVERYTYLVRT